MFRLSHSKIVLVFSILISGFSAQTAAATTGWTPVPQERREEYVSAIRTALSRSQYKTCEMRSVEIRTPTGGFMIDYFLERGAILQSPNPDRQPVLLVDTSYGRTDLNTRFYEMQIHADSTGRVLTKVTFVVKQLRQVNRGTLSNPRIELEAVVQNVIECEVR